MGSAVLPRHVAAAVVLAVAASCSSSVRHARLTMGNGVGIVFSTTTSSRLIDSVRQRDEQLIADEIRFGQPRRPAYCMPEESFSAVFSVAGARYDNFGTAPRGSGVPLRVIVYGEDERFVYVIARSYDPGITTIHIQLIHPALAGTMSSLGDRWFVFAAPTGTRAPWYVAGVLSASKTDGTRVTMSVPEGLDRLTPC
jgi:hypothetical protein